MKQGKGRFNVPTVVIFALIAIGLVYVAVSSPWMLILPVIVVGIIYLLYKYPPGQKQRQTRAAKPRKQTINGSKPGGTRQTSRQRSKTVPFRVIEGGKDDDDLPRYH